MTSKNLSDYKVFFFLVYDTGSIKYKLIARNTGDVHIEGMGSFLSRHEFELSIRKLGSEGYKTLTANTAGGQQVYICVKPGDEVEDITERVILLLNAIRGLTDHVNL